MQAARTELLVLPGMLETRDPEEGRKREPKAEDTAGKQVLRLHRMPDGKRIIFLPELSNLARSHTHDGDTIQVDLFS